MRPPASIPEPILVTGAAGFVGGAMTRSLREDGHRVVPTDRNLERAPDGTEPLNLEDADTLAAALQRHRPRSILHFAAFGQGDAGLMASAEHDPERAIAVNIDGFVGLLDAAAAAGVERVVWSSSTTVYGPPRAYAPAERVDERAAPAPTTTYGATKMLAERIAAQRRDRDGPDALPRVTALRLPLVYGPGRWYGGAQAAWMAFARDASRGHGGTYEFSDARTDWIFIDDAVAAVRATAGHEGPLEPTYNVGGTTTSAYEAAETLARLAGVGATITPKAAEPVVVLVDGSALQRATGYSPEASLDMGLQRWLRALEHEGRTP